jgi:hypothetical protein
LSNIDIAHYFNSIITKGRKDNTYKFALARFLVEYSYGQDIENKIRNNEMIVIKYSIIAKSFLKYYWHQICKYKIRQNYNLDKLPLIVQIIQCIFGRDYIPDSFESMHRGKIEKAEKEISRKCFREVVPRFQNILTGIRSSSQHVFYEYNENEGQINLKPRAAKYFKENYPLLLKTITLEWAKFLEKINNGLPMLISKVEGDVPERRSLEKARKVLSIYFDRCFYCNKLLPEDKRLVHVDHFIPWSYIYEDEIWNLVLSCKNCNLKKHSSLPQASYVERLLKRDTRYFERLELLRKSLLNLDPEYRYEKAVWKHYRSCIDYGFTVVNM